MNSIKKWSKNRAWCLLSLLMMGCIPLQGALPKAQNLKEKLVTLQKKLHDLGNRLGGLSKRLGELKIKLSGDASLLGFSNQTTEFLLKDAGFTLEDIKRVPKEKRGNATDASNWLLDNPAEEKKKEDKAGLEEAKSLTLKIINMREEAKRLRADVEQLRQKARVFKDANEKENFKKVVQNALDRGYEAFQLEEKIKELEKQLLAISLIKTPLVLQGPQGDQEVNAGLKNAGGNDCFFSASFQVLSQIGSFVDTLDKMDKDGKTTEIQNEFLTFIKNLRERPLKTVSRKGNQYNPAGDATTKFRNYITQNISLKHMQGIGQQDAQEFFSIFLNMLVENYQDLEKIFILYQQSKKSRDLLGPWSDLGKREKLLNLFLGIPKVSPGKKLRLEDCLAAYVAPEYLSDLNMGSPPVGGYKKSLLEAKSEAPLPKVLVITLRRLVADWNKMTAARLEDPIAFPTEFNKQYLVPYVDGNEVVGYRLFGIVAHVGSAYFDTNGNLGTSGHYRAYTMDRFDKKWREYDDRKYEDGRVLNTGEIIDITNQTKEKGTPYMLFYEKVEAAAK